MERPEAFPDLPPASVFMEKLDEEDRIESFWAFCLLPCIDNTGHDSFLDSRQRANAQLLESLRVCDNCRVRKTKCDMKQPSCTHCQKRRLCCSYSTKRKKPGPPKGGSDKNRREKALWSGSRDNPILHEHAVGLEARPDNPDERSAPARHLGQNDLIESNSISSDEFDIFSTEGEIELDVAVGPLQDLELADWLCPEFSFPVASQILSPLSSLSDESERTYLYQLYFDHLQALWPLLRKPLGGESLSAIKVPLRLEKAVFCVASRFADPGKTKSPKEYAQEALKYGSCSERMIDQVKSEFFLCVHSLAESITQESLAEVGRISRLASLCGLQYARSSPKQTSLLSTATTDMECEEWKSLWWSIYALDICCNALTATPNLLLSGLHVTAFPAVSLDSVTDLQMWELNIDSGFPQYLPTSELRYRDLMHSAFQHPATRSRNTHIVICSFMGAVTDLRSQAMYGENPGLLELLQDLESDSAAAKLVLPSWFINPARSFTIGEAAREHQLRLHTLLVWECADLNLSLAGAHASRSFRLAAQQLHWQKLWQCISSRAHEMIPVIQHCKSEYIKSLDPMCSYIVLLVACVLALDQAMLPPLHPMKTRLSANLDLMDLFMRSVGQSWPVGTHTAETFQTVRKDLKSDLTCEEATEHVLRMTDMSISFDPCKRFSNVS